jgi:hypothetical protein
MHHYFLTYIFSQFSAQWKTIALNSWGTCFKFWLDFLLWVFRVSQWWIRYVYVGLLCCNAKQTCRYHFRETLVFSNKSTQHNPEKQYQQDIFGTSCSFFMSGKQHHDPVPFPILHPYQIPALPAAMCRRLIQLFHHTTKHMGSCTEHLLTLYTESLLNKKRIFNPYFLKQFSKRALLLNQIDIWIYICSMHTLNWDLYLYLTFNTHRCGIH